MEFMSFRADIGIIGAMKGEVENIISLLEEREDVSISGVDFHTGMLFGRPVAVATCGIGKVFAALSAEIMILNFSPKLIVNTGVGGALDPELSPLDIVLAESLVQHDMDTSALGDPRGLVSGINKVYFECDKRAVEVLAEAAEAYGASFKRGIIATGDRFVHKMEDKEEIRAAFGASACEMEGCAIAQVAFVNSTPCAVVRAISDSADGHASLEYSEFLPLAESISTAITLELVKNW